MARALTPLEARVLGVLVEKQATVPDTYPLSLNSLVAGCNQKTARDPVINASESDVLAAIDVMIATLVADDLIVEAPEADTAVNPEPWTFAGFTLESFSDLEDILGLDPIHEADPDKGWPTARA
jgi:hypothetical protein